MSSTSTNTRGANSRLKGLLWAVGAIALVFSLITLAPIISHLG